MPAPQPGPGLPGSQLTWPLELDEAALDMLRHAVQRAPLPESLRGRALFDSGLGVEEIMIREDAGWTFRKTRISDQFDFEAAKADLPANADMLLLLRKNGTMRFFTHASRPTPQPGDTILSYVPPASKTRKKPEGEEE